MKRTAWSFLGLAVSLFLIIGCNGTGKNDESAYSMKVLPSELMIDVPASLTSGTAGASPSVSSGVTASVSSGVTASTASIGSTSTKFSTMKEWSSKTALYAILTDAAIVQSNVQPGESKTVDVTVTQDMVNSIIYVFSYGMIQKESVQVLVGQKVNVTVNYLSTPETGYNASVKVDVNDDSKTTVTVSWSLDKKLSKVTVSADNGAVLVAVVHNGNAQTSTVDVKVVNECEIKLGAAKENEGVLAYVIITVGTVSIGIEGFANDNAGYIKVDTGVSALNVGVKVDINGTAVTVTDAEKIYYEAVLTKYAAVIAAIKTTL